MFCREGVPDYPGPDVTWELCERFGVNLMFTAPTAVRMWMSHGPDAPNKYDLSLNRYKETVYQEEQHDPPKEILERMISLEQEIMAEMEELRGMLG